MAGFMVSVLPARRTLLETGETLGVALIGGAVFTVLHIPAGLVSGAMVAVAAAALAGRPMRVPWPLARICYVVVGMLIGTIVTPETLKGFTAWPASIAILVVGAVCMMAATMTYLRVVHGWDKLSALMGASPGSMAQVIALSSELGANLRAVAIVHVMRMLLLTVGIPGGLALFGLVAPGMPLTRAGTGDGSPGELALVVAVSTVAAIVLWRLRFPGGLLFGSMAGAAALHGTGLVHTGLPWWVAAAAVIVLGAVVGSRFANTTPRTILLHLGAAFGSFAVSLAVATLFASIVTYFFPFPFANVAVAFAPGAQDTMMVLSLALHLDPIYVGAHHVARFIVVTFTVAIAARRIAKDKTETGTGTDEPPR
jgi:membrane AbrB-like protein